MAQTYSGAEAEPEETPATLLLVEDEILIRMTVADYLRDCGYHVIEASNAHEALSVLRSDVAIDIVFTDVHMPGTMDGFALARWVHEHRPGIRVLLTSGVARTSAAAHDMCADAALVAKPYDHDSLLARIRSLLDR